MRRDIEGERILCRLCTACGAEVGFNPTTRRLWPDLKPWVGDLTNWATQVPLGLHFNFSGIYAGELQLLGQIVCPCLFFFNFLFYKKLPYSCPEGCWGNSSPPQRRRNGWVSPHPHQQCVLFLVFVWAIWWVCSNRSLWL